MPRAIYHPETWYADHKQNLSLYSTSVTGMVTQVQQQILQRVQHHLMEGNILHQMQDDTYRRMWQRAIDEASAQYLDHKQKSVSVILT